MRTAARVMFVVLLTAPFAAAGNLSFWTRLQLDVNGPSTIFWISVPYAYTPNDTNTNSLVDAEDLVQDFQPEDLPHPCAGTDCAVLRVWRWDTATGGYLSWTGGDPGGSPFELEPGAAYAIELQSVGGDLEHVIDLVGAHDPSYGFDDCYSFGGINLRWLSLPPHLAIDDSFGIPDVLDAEDLGWAMGGPEHVFQIRRLDEVTGLFENWVVGSEFGLPFAVDLSRSYAIDLSCADLAGSCGDCAWQWTPAHS